MAKTAILKTILLLAAMVVFTSQAVAFEIITEEDITENIITREMLIATADNFIILYDASGSMADAYKEGVTKLDAELEILKQQNRILPNLGYNAGLYSFTPFKAYYEVGPYDRQKFAAALAQAERLHRSDPDNAASVFKMGLASVDPEPGEIQVDHRCQTEYQ